MSGTKTNEAVDGASPPAFGIEDEQLIPAEAQDEHREELLDEAFDESFPASDPIGSQNVD